MREGKRVGWGCLAAEGRVKGWSGGVLPGEGG